MSHLAFTALARGTRSTSRGNPALWGMLALAGVGWSATSYAGISVTSFGPGVFNANSTIMDATLGITGYSIERFNNTTLMPGLFYELSSPQAFGPTNVMPALITTAVDAGATDNNWDDVFFLLNNNTNAFPDSGQRAISTTLYAPAGTTSFGIGISNAQSTSLPNPSPIANHELFINGVSFGLLESFPGMIAGRRRNIYLRIDATGSDLVQSVRITTLNNRTDESMIFDHIAILPSPGAGVLLALGGLMASRRQRR